MSEQRLQRWTWCTPSTPFTEVISVMTASKSTDCGVNWRRIAIVSRSILAAEITIRIAMMPERTGSAMTCPVKVIQAAAAITATDDIVSPTTVSYTHLRAHETDSYLVC